VSFNDSHDVALMHDPKILEQRAKVTLAGDKALMDPAAPRGAVVEVTMTDGKKVEHFTKYPPGTKENPLNTEAVAVKTRDLIVPVLGAEKSDKLIGQLRNLEKVDDIGKLMPLMRA
jgi:2-methylcitrate dehydratase PrpD